VDKRELDFPARRASFALLLFDRNILADLPALFAGAGYRVLGNRPFRGPFEAVYAELQGHRDTDDERIVLKGAYTLASGTAVLDPEMVLADTPQSLVPFCQARGLRCQSALWERVSESVLFADIKEGRIDSQTSLVRGSPSGAQIAPKSLLVKTPTSRGLQQLIAECGHDPNALFGHIEGYEFRLLSDEPAGETAPEPAGD
jgi:hypothetical protein